MTLQEIIIDSVGRKGDGIAFLPGGERVFVPRTVPGDRVRVRLLEKRGEVLYGDLVEVLESGGQRGVPACPCYDVCGGCSLQHMKARDYRLWKTDSVRELLERHCIRTHIFHDAVFIPAGVRRRSTFAAFLQNGRLRLGYRRRRSHEIADIPECMLLSPAIRKFASDIRPFLKRTLTDSRPVDVFVQESGGLLDVMLTGPMGKSRTPELAEREAVAETVHALGLARFSWRPKDRSTPETIVERLPFIKTSGRLSLKLPPGAFLQPSAEGEDALASRVMDALPPGRSLNTADFFAGCGTFSGRLLERGTVSAYENDPMSADNLAEAARRNGLRLAVQKRDLFREPLAAKELETFDAVILDPPRAGAKEQVAELAVSQVGTVVYVSCNPATFARDALVLEGGGYVLKEMSVIDQFVYSSHVELVGKFEKPRANKPPRV